MGSYASLSVRLSVCPSVSPSVCHWLTPLQLRGLHGYMYCNRQNGNGTFAVTGRAHCQRQVAFFLKVLSVNKTISLFFLSNSHVKFYHPCISALLWPSLTKSKQTSQTLLDSIQTIPTTGPAYLIHFHGHCFYGQVCYFVLYLLAH